MIEILKKNNSEPYKHFFQHYDCAMDCNQKNIEAISVSSFNFDTSEVESRYVNLKFITNDEWIFFSNYNSPKAKSFLSNNQIACLFYWRSTNTQIRLKALIKKTSKEFNNNYFFNRSLNKNALAISSHQSDPIDSYNEVTKNFNKCLESSNLRECPDYWGGYSFTPYYFEFWKGHESRINKRDVYQAYKDNWNHYVIQP